jgi:amino acid permease
MKKIIILQKTILTVAFVIVPFFTAMAQEGFGEDTDDITPVLPIDDYVWLMLVFAIYVAFRFFKQDQIINSEQ